MVAILNVIKGKNKVIVSGLAGALSALIFLTAIHIATKIAIIVAAAVVTYTLLSLIHKVTAKKDKSAKTPDVLEDEGYSSVDEGEEKGIVVSGEKPEETEAESKQDDAGQTQYEENYMSLMQSPPEHMDGAYREIKEVNAPRIFVSNCPMKIPKRLTMEHIVNQRD